MAKFDTADRWAKTYEESVDGIQDYQAGKKVEAGILMEAMGQPEGKYQQNLRELIDIHASITAFFDEFEIDR